MKTPMNTTIPTSSIQGPPFPCPECASEGTRITFPKRPGLGNHRLSKHGIVGSSTGSKSYKQNHAPKRTYTKHTPVVRGKYNKKPKTNPLLDMIENPERTANELSAIIADKHSQVHRLQCEIEGLNINISTLQRFYDMIKPRGTTTQTPQEFSHAVA